LQYKFTVLTNTTIGSFMSQLDSNIVLIALPTIVRELPGTTAIDALWVLMGYILMTAVTLLTFGRLADMFGKVRLYNAGFAVFTIGSGLCSISQTGSVLVGFRLVQGVGAALIWSNNAAIITDAFPPTERGRAIGINLVAGISGSVIGLVLGGVLTASSLGWRSIFWINLPIGAFATFWAHLKLRELGTIGRGKIDPAGNVLFGGGLSLSLVGLTLGALYGWSLAYVAAIVLGLGMLGGFALVELHIPNPMMDLKLFKIRPFTAGIISNFLASIARGGTSLVLTFYFQGALLYSAFASGILLIPFAVAFVTVGPLSGLLSDRYGARGFTTAGLIVSAAAYFLFAALPGNVQYSLLVIPMILAGAGGGMFVAPNMSSIMNATPVMRRGVASGMSATLVTTGSLLSLSIAFAVMAINIPSATLQAIFAGVSLTGTPNVAPFVGPMRIIWLVMAAMSLVAVVPSALRGPKFAGVPESKFETPRPVAEGVA
jgi:EmrB/QacA subfamily drug resistance transporter